RASNEFWLRTLGHLDGGGRLLLDDRLLHVNDDRLRIVQDLDSLGGRHVLDVDHAANLQLADVDTDRVGHGNDRALDLQRVDRLIEQAAAGDSRGGAAPLDPYFQREPPAARHALEVNVDDLPAEMVPLQFLDLSGYGALVGLQFDDVNAVPDRPGQLLRGDADRHRVLLVPVDDSGDAPLPTKTAGQPCA